MGSERHYSSRRLKGHKMEMSELLAKTENDTENDSCIVGV